MMSSRRRQSVEILLEILDYAKVSEKKTRLMHKCNLNLSAFEKYCTFLEGRGFLERTSHQQYRKDKRTRFLYKTTQKGVDALKQAKSMYPLSELFEYIP